MLIFFIYPPPLVCKHTSELDCAARYFIPPTALTNNLASALRACFFHILPPACVNACLRHVFVARRYGICFWRIPMPPTALTNNLASALRACFFHILPPACVNACLRQYMKKQPHGCLQGCFFVGAVWHNLYEPVLEETAVLSAVSISFSVFVTCSFVSFRCSGLSAKL